MGGGGEGGHTLIMWDFDLGLVVTFRSCALPHGWRMLIWLDHVFRRCVIPVPFLLLLPPLFFFFFFFFLNLGPFLWLDVH